MKAIYLTFLSLAFPVLVNAAPHKLEIDSKVLYRGQKIGSPRITVANGDKARFRVLGHLKNREFNIELRPLMTKSSGLNLHYSIVMRESGDETYTRGSLRLGNNKNGKVVLDKGKIQLHLKVTPQS